MAITVSFNAGLDSRWRPFFGMWKLSSHDSLFINYVSQLGGFEECETIERRNFSASQIWVEGGEVQILFTLLPQLPYFDMLLLPSAATG